MTAGVRASHEDGLSLIEMMVAVLVLGVVFSALASVLITALQSLRGQETTTQATAAINDLLEEAQRVEFDDAVLCDTKAATAFADETPTGTFEGEDLVVSPDVCGATAEIEPQRTVTRDGHEYDVTTAITWSDEPEDGLGTADSDTPHDIKRITVDVSWTVNGETRTARNVGFRAPQLQEQLLTAEVVADDGGTFIEIADDATVDGENTEALTLRAFAGEKLTAVQVEWVDRTGALQSKPMTADTSQGLVWEYHIGANFGPFANGGALFRFEGTTTAGETAEVTARGLFLYDPMSLIGGTIQDNFTLLQIDRSSGEVCPGQAVWVDVRGAIRSDLGRVEWPRLTSPADSMASVEPPAADADLTLSGARFRLDLDGRTDFATYDSTAGEYVPVVDPNHIRVRVRRVIDDTVLIKERDTMGIEMVDAC